VGYFDKFEAQETKLANILEDKFLLHKFCTDTYPITLTITQNQTPDAQMAIYESEDDGASSHDAKLIITFPVGEIGHRVYGRLIIPDTLLGKIKNCGKKMRDLWLQADHAARMEQKKQYGSSEAEADVGAYEDHGDFQEFFEDDDNETDEGAEE